LRGRWETTDGEQGLLEALDGLTGRGREERASPRSQEVLDRLVPDLPPEGMVCETLGLLVQAIGVEDLNGAEDPSVKPALAILKQTAVGHLVGQRVLERVFHFGDAARLVQEIRRLKVGEALAELLLRDIGDGLEKTDVDVGADHGRRLKQPFILERKAIDAGSKDGLHAGRPRNAVERPGEPVGPPRADQRLSLYEATHCLLEKEGVT